MLSARSWPGNVRELANFIERLAVMSDERMVSPETVSRVLFEGAKERREPLVARRYGSLAFAEARELFERDYLVQKLRECDYNVAKAADASGIHPSGLHAKIKKYGIEQEK
jgi:two-component system nitrogen regulation response regulator NtrX